MPANPSPQLSGEDREGHGNGRSRRDASLLGYRLSRAHGYTVVSSEGTELGVVHGLRYEGHADYPDEILVRRGRIRRAVRPISFDLVESVDTRNRVIRVRGQGVQS